MIPARIGSTRLPGKALADIGGVPMVERVRRLVVRARGIDRVLVATDDQRIESVVRDFGGEVVRTGPASNGTSRVAAAVAAIDADFVVNVQGDMPLVDPAHVEHTIGLLRSGASIATLATPLCDPSDPAAVKVVRAGSGAALYFSRAPIPHRGPWLRHIGIYGFRSGTLRRLVDLPSSDLERSEDLEQLRWLEAGIDIQVGVVEHAESGVDTPEQLAAMRRRIAELETAAHSPRLNHA